jgi:tRNA(His) 5'-end guanylyltransferase
MELPRLNNQFVIVRVDGKNFSKLTKSRKTEDEFNLDIYNAMVEAAHALVKAVDGAMGAYVVSDEISVLIDMTDPTKTPWFDGRVEKILSVTSSIATAHFNKSLGTTWYFDSKVVYTGNLAIEVEDYFQKRHRNGYSNAISSYASRHFGHNTVHGWTTRERIVQLQIAGIETSRNLKHGAVVYRETRTGDVTFINKRTGESETAENVVRHYWCIEDLTDGTGLYKLTRS